MKALLIAFCASCALACAGERERPLMRDFIGPNVDAKPLITASSALRSYPEDPATKWLENLRIMQKSRAGHAQTKELWETEFGCDMSTKPVPSGGEFPIITEEQQAMWAVRAFLLLAGLGVDRAHLITAKTAKGPQLHSDGSAPKLQPKPVFHALAWLRRSLGDYRFVRVEREDAGDCFCYEFMHNTDAKKRIWAIWKPAGDPLVVRLFHDPLLVTRAERMPLGNGDAEASKVTLEIEGYLAIQAQERPILIWLDEK